jgi:hypothetical protein
MKKRDRYAHAAEDATADLLRRHAELVASKEFQKASAKDRAKLAIEAGWTDAETSALLAVDGNSDHAQVIANVRGELTRSAIVRELEDLSKTEPEPAHRLEGEAGERGRRVDEALTADGETQKKIALTARISELFALTSEKRIVRIIEYQSEPREYAIETANGFVRLGGIRCLLNQDRLRHKIAEAVHQMIPTFRSTGDWAKIEQSLLDALIKVPVGDAATDAGIIADWLQGYLQSKPGHGRSSFDEVNGDGLTGPFMANGQPCIFLQDLRTWIHRNHGDSVPVKELCILLRRAGAVPLANPLTVKRDRKRTTVRVWVLPQATLPPGDDLDLHTEPHFI